MTTSTMTQTQLLLELEPVVGENLNRHLSMAKEWFPHEYVPWSDGRNFDGVLDGDPWSPDDSPMSDVARSSLIVNLLTEDNLPSYHHEIASLFGREAAWGEWVHRWTAEEGRHGIAIRDYLLTSRAVDPVQLEELRMQHMSTGYSSAHGDDMLRSLAYVSFQELATRVSRRLCSLPPTRPCARSPTWSRPSRCPAPTSQGSSGRPSRWRSPASTTSGCTATTWSRRC
jgi:acyl-[acyl-carrier-protein] desaturase